MVVHILILALRRSKFKAILGYIRPWKKNKVNFESS